MSRYRFALASLMLVLSGFLIAADSAGATFAGRNGRIAWSVFNAGGGGGGGFASLASYPARLSNGNPIASCLEDNEGNVCNNWQNVSYSPDGKHLMWDQTGASGAEVITLANSDGSHPQTIMSDGFADFEASFGPTGEKIVYVRQTQGAGGPFWRLAIGNLSDGAARLVSPSIQGAQPLFSPNGKTILFVRLDKDGNQTGLWSIRPDGHELHRLVAHVSAFDISPSGKSIAYMTSGGGVFIAEATGHHPRRIARKPTGDLNSSAVRFSPDGKLVAFTAMASLGQALYVIRAAGGKPRLISGSEDPRTVTTGLSWQPLHP
jgi:Tol biopolymer transport system component